MKRIALLVIIYLIVWGSLYKANSFNQTDSLWSVYTTISIVKEGNLDLDEFQELFPKAFHANLIEISGRTYNYYPYGISILVIPYIWIAEKWYQSKNLDLSEIIKATSTINLEKNLASSLLALSSCILFFLALQITQSTSKSIVIIFLFSFCTLIFSCLSRGLWQHVGSIFILNFTLLSLMQEKKTLLIFTALPLFFSYIVRPTNILPIFLFSLIIIYQLRWKSVYFILIGILVLITFYYVNLKVFGNFIHPYYDFKKISSGNNFQEALLGNLFSPARGLFVYSPIFLFSFYGVYLKRKWESINLIDYAILLIIFIHWILVSRNLNWWGGHSFGYRLLSDLIPFFMFYLIYYLKYLDYKSFLFGIFIFCILVSFSINFRGANYQETYFWNLIPTNIDDSPERNWDWKDPPFLR